MKRTYAKYELARWVGVLISILGLVIVIGSESVVNNHVFYPTVTAGALTMVVGVLTYSTSKSKELLMREKLRRHKRKIRLVVRIHEQR